MNVAALLLNKNSMFVEDFQVNEEGKGNSSSFAHILQKKLPNVSKELQDFLLHSNLLAAEDMNELLVSLNNTEHEEQLIKDLLQNVFGQLTLPLDVEQNIHLLQEEHDEYLVTLNNGENIPKSLLTKLQTNLQQFSKQITELIQLIIDEPDVQKHKMKLLQLLKENEEFQKLTQRLQIPRQPIKLTNAKLQSLWDKLSEAYSRRTSLNNRKMYANEAKVDQRTLTRWLDNVIQEYEGKQQSTQKTEAVIKPLHIATPMTKVEQLVIFQQNNELRTSTTFEQQLLLKFEEAIRSSQILRANQGPNQLLFHLKPENLGEMMVRLEEVNGEMTAKIIVTTEAAKKALQSNIHQLKNMFSPHQVVIERQDEIVLQQTEEKGDHFEEEQEQFSEHEEHQEGQQDEKEEYEEVSFHEVLSTKV